MEDDSNEVERAVRAVNIKMNLVSNGSLRPVVKCYLNMYSRLTNPLLCCWTIDDVMSDPATADLGQDETIIFRLINAHLVCL